MEKKGYLGGPKQTASGEAEALDTINARIHPKFDPKRLVEASIEAKAKKRRTQHAPTPSAWKRCAPILRALVFALSKGGAI